MSEQKGRGERLSEADNTGWRRLLEAGASPYMVRDIQGSVDLLWDGADGCRITPLAPNFTACGPSVDGPRLELQKDVIYYLVEN
jgi:hypothetical protein